MTELDARPWHIACCPCVSVVTQINCRVLVADDEPDLLHFVSILLASAGVVVVTATTGAELLDRVAEDGDFDLVITDISMPWMTGLQVTASMREAGLEVPVIVMTGLNDASLPARVRALGDHVRLLRKPFDLDQLIEAVTQALPSLRWPAPELVAV